MAGDRDREHLYDLLEGFSNAMLVTCAGEGVLHARPMAIAGIERNGPAWFATSIDSPKVAEIENDPRVLLVFQGTARFASVEGRARIERDRGLVERLWSPEWKMRFPEGKDVPSLCILEVEPRSAELWDNSGGKGMRYLFEGAKAVLQGRRPEAGPGQHAKVQL